MKSAQSAIRLNLRRSKTILLFTMFLLATVALASFQNCSKFGSQVGGTSGSLSGITSVLPQPIIPQPLTCSFNGQTLAEGASVTAFATSNGLSCQSEMRECKSGVLSGSYTFASCIVNAPAACLFNGVTVPSGSSTTAFVARVSTGGSCASETRTCNDGVLSGSASYPSCVTVTDNVSPASGLATVNPGCSLAGNVVNCELLPKTLTAGKQSEIGIATGTYLKFTNNTGKSLQLNQVAAVTGETTYVAEYCVFLQDFRTGQLTAGIGEVGCFQKVAGEAMPSLRWGTSTSLAIPPDAVVYVGFNTDGKTPMSFVLDIDEQTSGIYSYRAPQIDESFPCDGVSRSTTWKPWQNTTGSNLYLMGAQIYVANGGLLSMDSACIYILDANQAVKFTSCDGANKRGFVSFASQTVLPGEYVVGQARNSCSNAGGWDWVAYMQLSH